MNTSRPLSANQAVAALHSPQYSKNTFGPAARTYLARRRPGATSAPGIVPHDGPPAFRHHEARQFRGAGALVAARARVYRRYTDKVSSSP